MDNEERLNALRKFFTADRYVALSGIEIDEVTDEYAQVKAVKTGKTAAGDPVIEIVR